MPLYDYKCTRCSDVFEQIRRIDERRDTECPTCGGKADLQIPRKAPGLSLFQPGWWRDLDYDPVYINSPQELRNVCDKKNVDTGYLHDGVWKTSPGPDPTPDSAPELFKGRGSDGGDG